MLEIRISPSGKKLSPAAPLFLRPSTVRTAIFRVDTPEFFDFQAFVAHASLRVQPTHAGDDAAFALPFQLDGTDAFALLSLWSPQEGRPAIAPGVYRASLCTTGAAPSEAALAGVASEGFLFTVSPSIMEEGISLVTVLTHCLGPLAQWDDVFGSIVRDRRFNCVHFTPINRFGGSHSCYSLATWSPEDLDRTVQTCDAGCTVATLASIREYFDRRFSADGRKVVHPFSDLVLNHVAPESDIVQASVFNTFNTLTRPYLLPAALLDMHFRVVANAILSNFWDPRLLSEARVFGDAVKEPEQAVLRLSYLRTCFVVRAPDDPPLVEVAPEAAPEAEDPVGAPASREPAVRVDWKRADAFMAAISKVSREIATRLRLNEYERLSHASCLAELHGLLERNSVKAGSPEEYLAGLALPEAGRQALLPAFRALRAPLDHGAIRSFLFDRPVNHFEEFTCVTGSRRGARILYDKLVEGFFAAVVFAPFAAGVRQAGHALTEDLVASILPLVRHHVFRCLQNILVLFVSEVNHRVDSRSADDISSIMSAVYGGVKYRLFESCTQAYAALFGGSAQAPGTHPSFDIYLHAFQPVSSLSAEALADLRRGIAAYTATGALPAGADAPLHSNLSYGELLRLLETNPVQMLRDIEAGKVLCAASNGWVMGLAYDFTTRAARAYLRCQVVAWGDCTKLAFSMPEDTALAPRNLLARAHAPARNERLWAMAEDYTLSLVGVFDGLRIDNAHSTDPELLRHLLCRARRAKPELFVLLECFLGDEDAEARFLQDVGGNTLVKELVHLGLDAYPAFMTRGAQALGALQLPDARALSLSAVRGVAPSKRGEGSTQAPQLVFDVTHDNFVPGSAESVHTLRNRLVLSTLACGNSVGGMASTFLVDEEYPWKVGVTEQRSYSALLELSNRVLGFPAAQIETNLRLRALLTRLHVELTQGGFSQAYAHRHAGGFILSVERFCPQTGRAYVFLVRPSFKNRSCAQRGRHTRNSLSRVAVGFENTSPSTSLNNSPLLLPQTFRPGVSRLGGLATATASTPALTDAPGTETATDESGEDSLLRGIRVAIPGYFSRVYMAFNDFDAIRGVDALAAAFVDDQRARFGNDLSGDAARTRPEFSVFLNDDNFPEGSILVLRKESLPCCSAVSFEQLCNLAFPYTPADRGVCQTQLAAPAASAASAAPGAPADGHIGALLRRAFGAYNTFCQKWFLSMTPDEEQKLIGQGAYVFENDRGRVVPTVCGFDGLLDVFLTGDIGGPACENVRQGHWFMDYVVARVQKYEALVDADARLAAGAGACDVRMSALLACVFGKIKELPSSLQPVVLFRALCRVSDCVNEAILEREGLRPAGSASASASAGAPIPEHTKNLLTLYRASLLLVGFDPHCSNVDVDYARAICARIAATRPGTDAAARAQAILAQTGPARPYSTDAVGTFVSLSAGYPHFFSGLFRSWGRDLSMSVTGLLTLFPSRRPLARSILATSLSLLRHGLLPNLQDSGRRPRYNCRDALWYLLCSLFDYIRITGDTGVLQEDVVRFYPADDPGAYALRPLREFLQGAELRSVLGANEMSYYVVADEGALLGRCLTTVGALVAEALTRHFRDGVRFREWNAGEAIDGCMHNEGFNIDVYVEKARAGARGLVFGGNEWNCGTWMDKMGSSRDFNRGVPGSSRHGAAAEINLCCYAVLAAVTSLPPDVRRDAGLADGALDEWRGMLGATLESDAGALRMQHGPTGARVLRDVVLYADDAPTPHAADKRRAFAAPQDQFLRPNYLIGLSYCDAGTCTRFAEEIRNGIALLHTTASTAAEYAAICDGSRPGVCDNASLVGIRTLSSLDARYVPFYDNDSQRDFETAGGLSYHNGPAWVHPFARAILAALRAGLPGVPGLLANANRFLDAGAYVNGGVRSLPELQQAGGEHCAASCTSQAWAIAGFLEVYDALVRAAAPL